MIEQWYWLMPNSVLFDKELTDKQKLLFCLISSLCAEKWYCWATNERLWELLWANRTTISKNISELQEKGFISIVLEDWHSRKIYLVENAKGGCEKSQGGLWKITTPIILYNNTIDNNIATDVSDLYKNYYWKNKWIDEKKCNKLIIDKLNQWISYSDIRNWMVLYNCECRLKQDFKFVKKFETRIKEFQALEEQQINEELYAIIKNFIEKRKTDDKFWQSSYAKTILNDLKQTFGEDKVKWMWKQANSIQLNFT